MGAIAAPLALGTSIGSTILGIQAGREEAASQEAAGKLRQAEIERKADQEKISTVEREAGRRRRINELLGSTIARTGASGVTFEGSPQAVAEGAIKQQGLAESSEKVSDLSRIAQLRRTGELAKVRGRQAKRQTLLTTTAQAGRDITSIAKSF